MNLEEVQARWDGEARGDDGEEASLPKAPEELT